MVVIEGAIPREWHRARREPGAKYCIVQVSRVLAASAIKSRRHRHKSRKVRRLRGSGVDARRAIQRYAQGRLIAGLQSFGERAVRIKLAWRGRSMASAAFRTAIGRVENVNTSRAWRSCAARQFFAQVMLKLGLLPV
jgi:hypothetical protein